MAEDCDVDLSLLSVLHLRKLRRTDWEALGWEFNQGNEDLFSMLADNEVYSQALTAHFRSIGVRSIRIIPANDENWFDCRPAQEDRTA